MKSRFTPLFLLLLLGLLQTGAAQKAFYNKGSIGFQTHYGTFLTHSPKAAYLRDSYSSFYELNFQQQTDGSKPWHAANGMPQWGVAFFYGNTGSRQYMGSMAGAFGFINVPLLKRKSFTSKLRGGMGLGWIQKPYNKAGNHKNVLIGSSMNGYMGFLWQNELRLSSKLFFNAGLSFTHFSNGGSTMPNLGLNIPALSVGLRYGAGEGSASHTTPSVKKQNIHYSVFASAGTKQAPWVESKRYLVNTASIEISKPFGYSSTVSGGLVLSRDKSLEVHPAGIPSLKRKGNYLRAGVYGAYEHRFGNVSVPLQLGAYVYNKDLSPLLFQNIGMRYGFRPAWSAQVLLKTHMGQADHLQIGLGYHFNKKR